MNLHFFCLFFFPNSSFKTLRYPWIFVNLAGYPAWVLIYLVNKLAHGKETKKKKKAMFFLLFHFLQVCFLCLLKWDIPKPQNLWGTLAKICHICAQLKKKSLVIFFFLALINTNAPNFSLASFIQLGINPHWGAHFYSQEWIGVFERLNLHLQLGYGIVSQFGKLQSGA